VTRKLLTTIGLCALASTYAAPRLPAIISDGPTAALHPLPDFSYAGYGFGIAKPELGERAVVEVDAFGAKAGDALDDSVAVLAALKQAHATPGPVTLRFSAGRYIVSEVLSITRSEIIIEGAGRGEAGTELYFPRPLRIVDQSPRLDELRAYLKQENKRQVEPLNNIDLAFSPHSWSGGFIWVQAANSRPFEYLENTGKAAGLTVRAGLAQQFEIELSKVSSSLHAGDVIELKWFSTKEPNNSLIDAIYGADREKLVSPVGQRHWDNPSRALVTQITRIESVSGTKVRIANPLMHDINANLHATFAPWRGLREVGIRDLALVFPPGVAFGHHLEEGWNGIYFTDVYNGWIDSIRTRDADSAVLTYHSGNVTISNVLTEGERKAHYSVHLGNVHNVLVRDLQVHNAVVHSISFNTLCTRSVFQRVTLWRAPTIDQHAGINQQNLVDDLTAHIDVPSAKTVAVADAQSNLQTPPSYSLWDGSGAAYWQPGHGRYNTHWNIKVVVKSGALPDQTVMITGLDEGPDARVIGLNGNRNLRLDYRPAPYVERVNESMSDIPSLYDWQLARRLSAMNAMEKNR
jgi:hypothetical protein